MDLIKGESSPNPTVSAGGIVEAIMESWKALARHGDDCEQCGEVVAALRKVPDDWLPFYDQCCKDGQELFGVWADARQGMVEQFKDPTTRRDGSLSSQANALGNMMYSLQQRRKRLGMIGLSQKEAHIRALALEGLPADAFNKLLAVEDDQARENEIQALVNAQRRTHSLVEIRPTGRSTLDNRIMFDWFCVCGERSHERFMDAETAKTYWGRHAGLLVSPPDRTERTCRHCGGKFHVVKDSKDRYCSREHAEAAWKT